MSSLRNAVQRRNHRERAQPAERAKWGLLEKRKDYKLRAADHKVKKRKINALKQKASERNEDEFYFGMMSSKTKGGIKVSKRGEENSGGGGKALSMDVVKLMKTQDQGYLQTMLQKTRKEIARLENDVTLGTKGIKLSTSTAKITFDEDGERIEPSGDAVVKQHGQDVDFDLDFDMSDEGEGVEDDDEDSANDDMTPEQKDARERKRHALDVKRRKLAALREQAEKLSSALEQVEAQRARMKGTVGGVNKNGVRFKVRERSR